MASIKQFSDLDFQQVAKILNVILDTYAGNPGSPVEGQIWYDSTAKKLKFRDNAGNIDPTARANHSGTQLASTISDFDTQVRTSRLDQMTAPTADVSFNTHKITNLVDPSNAQDAATKAYVDAARAGLDVKQSVRVATAAALPAYTRTGNIITASANGALTVDGVAVTAGDRVLVKDGAAGADNGIYDVTNAGAVGAAYVLTRSSDADASAEVTSGMFTFVEEGTTNDNAGYVLATNNPITLNTTALTFNQFSGVGALVAGAGLTKTGSTVDAVAATAVGTAGPGGGLKVNADDIAVDHDVIPVHKQFNVGNGAATTIDLVHNLGTRDVVVETYLNSGTYESISVHTERPDANTVRLIFPSAPASNAYRAVVIG